MTAQNIISLYRRDLSESEPIPREFPVTPMSAGLARATQHVLEVLDLPRDKALRALDVGTGCGVQSAILAFAGCRDVRAIDICEEAVAAAQTRFRRLAQQLATLRAEAIATPQYEIISLIDIADRKDIYDIVVANPPSYFTQTTAATPLEFGLYDGVGHDAHDPKKSFLYKFFDRLVDPCLAPGGVAICTWPGLQARLVHDLSDPKRPIVHPAILLEKWFGWTITLDEPCWERFFSADVPISYAGMDDGFLQQLTKDIRQRRYYSSLVKAAGPTSGFRPSFPFGVLVLVRDRDESRRLRLHVLDSKTFQEGL